MSTKNNNQNKTEESKFWDETRENVTEGAKILEEEARELAKKLGLYSEKIFGKVKKYTTEALQYGSELTKDAVNRAQEVAEKFRDRIEMRKLNDQKKEASAQLGIRLYLALKNNDDKLPRGFMNMDETKSILKRLEEIDAEILKTSENLEK